MSKILIVDDEPTIVELLEEHLQSEGYDTLRAYSGEEALRVLGTTTPDLLILDLMLPGMDGYEVCRLMQSDARLNHIPVIMLTARSAVSNRVMGYERGADDYIVKPFDADELSVRVRAQLHHLYHDSVSELTGLPGAQAIEQQIKERTAEAQSPWAIMYVDIKNFTAYNESYSFLEGDEMIKIAAHVLTQAISDKGNSDDFLGHMGGDQFVIVTTPDRTVEIKEEASCLFAESTPDFYSPTDREERYFAGITHQGMMARLELCTLDFDLVTIEEE
ncbi:MAG: response regulator [Chloroflexota bacterium]|nr:response regulator [Chloroflexota bacterium]